MPTRRRFGELMQGVFRVLEDHPEGLPAREVLVAVERVVPPTDFEQSEYPSNPGVRRFEKIIRFSTINAVKAGWLIKSKGQWTLTDEGRRAFKDFSDPEEFMRESVRLYQAWRRSRPVVESESAADRLNEEEPDQEEDAGATSAIEEAEESAWQEIDRHVRSLNPYEFQDLAAALLRAMGYHVAWVSPPGPDRGLDILAYTDPLGAEGPRIKVQVKHRVDKVSAEVLRGFMALLSDQDVGIFISSGGFTSDAEREVRSQERRRITLIDVERLFDLWVEHYENVSTVERQLLPLKAVQFLLPPE